VMRATRAGRAWLGTHGAELRLALRVTASGLIAFALAELLGLAQGYWAVFTAIIVVQGSVGGSLKAGLDRLLGTLGGAAYGALIGVLIPHAGSLMEGVVLAAAIAPLALLAAVNASFRIAPVTAVIVLLVHSGDAAGPLASAVGRVIEIGLGCLVGLGVSLIVLPARAHGLLVKTAARGLALEAELLGAASRQIAGASDRAALQGINDRVAAVLRRLEAIKGEAEHERRTRLSGAPDPDPLIRSVRRLRSDLIVVARAVATPLPASTLRLLGPAFAEAVAALVDALRDTSEALASGRDPPAIDAALAALDRYAAAMEEFCQALPTLDLLEGEAERIFALSFALAQMRGDLGDLVARAGAFTRPAPSTA
jgi:uncharacterized membrane protein YccC